MFVTAMLLVLQAPIADAQPDPATDAPAPKPKKERVIQAEARTGSRTNFRQICHTKEEWAMIARENRNQVDKAQRERGWYQK